MSEKLKLVSTLELPELASEAQDDPKAAAIITSDEVLKDLTLRAELRFGTAKVTLEQLYAMKHGAVFSLDQSVDAPIELLIEGRVFARGELVAVGENLGIKVLELATAK